MNDGGPAFPMPVPHYAHAEDTGGTCGSDGMSLRDYFAAAAMQAIIAKFPIGCAGKDFVFDLSAEPERLASALVGVSTGAYAYADAMLKARESK